MKALYVLAMAGLLVACSSGSDSDADSGTPVYGDGAEVSQLIINGKILDIDGLGFKTETVSGITLDGKFSYNAGESVQFMLGNTQLGELKEVDQANLATLLHGEYVIPTGEEFRAALNSGSNELATLPKVALSPLHVLSNKIKLLLLLDKDKNSDNGLDLVDWHAKLKDVTINLNTSLYDNSEFLAVFQNVEAPNLHLPTAIDLAEPLRYYHKGLLGQEMSAYVVRKMVVTNEQNNFTTTNDYEFDELGRVKNKVRDFRRTDNLEQAMSEDSWSNTFDKFGEISEEFQIQKRDLDQDTPVLNYDKRVRENSGYYHTRQHSVVLFTKQVEHRGPTADAMVFHGDEHHYYENVPFLADKHDYSSVQRDKKYYRYNYEYQYDAKGRFLDLKGRYRYFEEDDSLITDKKTNHESISYQQKGNAEVVKISQVDKHVDGVLDGIIDETTTTTLIKNSEGNAVTCTSVDKDKDGVIDYADQERFSYQNVSGQTILVSSHEYLDKNKDGIYGGDGQEEEDSGQHVLIHNDEGQLTTETTVSSTGSKTVLEYQYVQANEDSTNAGKLKAVVQKRVFQEDGSPKYTDNYGYVYNQEGKLTTINLSTPGVPANERKIDLVYQGHELAEYTVHNIATEKKIDVVLQTEMVTDGIGYLIHRQTDKLLNTDVVDGIDYRVRVDRPTSLKVSNSCNF